MQPAWARSLRDQCTHAGVPFLFKQWGEWLPAGAGESHNGAHMVCVGKKAAGRELDGSTHDDFPLLPAKADPEWIRG
jgi:protein gp37